MKHLKTLIIEDSKDDTALLLRHLSLEGYEVQSAIVQTPEEIKDALSEREWDIILSDYTMPQFSGLEALSILKEMGLDIPFIIISGSMGEDLAVDAMLLGADDYLMKDNLIRLAPAIERELENAASRREHKKAEEALRRSEENLANAQRIAHIGSWEMDLVTNQIFWSSEVYRIFGVSKDNFEITLEAFFSFIHPEDKQSVQDAADAALSQIAPYEVEHRIITQTGVERIVCAIGEVTFDESGKPLRFTGTVQDITERKQFEKALENAAKREVAMINNSLDVICTIDAEGKFVTVSPASLKIWGYQPEELVGQAYIELVASEDVAKTNEAAIEVMSGVVARDFENCYRHKNGSMVHIRWTAFWSDTEQLMFCVAHDITERKLAEEEKIRLAAQIEQQHERLNNIIDNVAGVVWEAWGKPDEATQKIDFISDYVETMLGYTVEEWLETPNFWLSIVHPDDRERMAQVAAENFLKSQSFTEEFRWITKDGRTVWVKTLSTAICDNEGQAIGYRGVNIDITERKRLEEERNKLIVESNYQKARLQHIFEHIPAFIVVLRGPDHVFEMANPAYYPIVDHREVIGLPLREALPELEGQGFFELISNVYNTGEVFTGNELSVQLVVPNSNKREQCYVNLMYMPLREADDSISGVLSYGIDVTEQVLSRLKIQESEERYRFLFENNPLPMWVFDLETLRFLSVNAAAIQHYGYSLEEFLNMTVKDIRPPEDVSILLEIIKKDMPGVDNAGVFRHRKKDGTVIYVEIITNQLIFDGRKARMVLANNVTERRKMEESVRFQAHLLSTVEQSVVATDLNGIVIYWNQFAEKLYGWTSAEAVGRKARDLTTPEISTEQSNQIMAQLSAGKSWSGEFVVRNKAGAHFPVYATTSPVNDETGKLIGTVAVSVDITERKNAEKALLQAEAKYRNLVESSPAVAYLCEPFPPYATIYVSPNISRFGFTKEEWIEQTGMWANIIHEDDRRAVLHTVEVAIEQKIDPELEYRIVRRDGTIIWLHDKGRFVLDEQGNIIGWQGVMVDITKTKELEEQLRQSQKLESIGLLAGGIAHDFNNMLTAINGYSDLTLRLLKEEDPIRGNIMEIKKAGERSALLTYQLLAFSRQQLLHPIVVDINETIMDTIKIIQRLIGEDIQLVYVLDSKIGRVKVDPGQMSQILMNLAVNSRDAMPAGGKLIIETNNVFIEPDYARHHVGILPGAYVMLSVSDNGSGMSSETKKRIFEPFFTTKEIGKGTGLGLPTVYGIVKQSGGNIEVESNEGVGTKFKIYLPRVTEQLEAENTRDIFSELPGGSEKILLVEDEEIVRNLTRQILEDCGYSVIEAQNGIEALWISDEEIREFDLLLTDVVMPQMGGRELAAKLKTKAPNLRVLFTSGYTDDKVVRHDVIEANMNFIQKPFSPKELADKVREIIDNSPD